MFGIFNFGLFLSAGILLNIAPGADTMYILGRSISQGKKAGIISVLGIGSGSIVHTALVALGLSALLAKSIWAFMILKYCGAAYLIYLGMRSLLSKRDDSALQAVAQDGIKKIYWQGVLNSVMNPKVALFFIAFLPQFVTKHNSFGPLPFIILGLTFVMAGTIWLLLLANFAAMATAKLRENPIISTVMTKLTGILFIGLGLNLLRVKAAS